MKPSALCGTLATIMFIIGLNGQATGQQREPVPAEERPIVAIGCINRAQQNGSPAGAPGVPPAPPEAIPDLANSVEPTGAFLLNGAKEVVAAKESQTAEALTAESATYVLDGSRAELDRHLGHQVEVTGILRVVKEGPKAFENTVGHVRVISLNMVATSCPKAGSNKG